MLRRRISLNTSVWTTLKVPQEKYVGKFSLIPTVGRTHQREVNQIIRGV